MLRIGELHVARERLEDRGTHLPPCGEDGGVAAVCHPGGQRAALTVEIFTISAAIRDHPEARAHPGWSLHWPDRHSLGLPRTIEVSNAMILVHSDIRRGAVDPPGRKMSRAPVWPRTEREPRNRRGTSRQQHRYRV